MSKKSLKQRLLSPNSSTWRNKADKMWKLLAHLNQNNKCAICGSIEWVQAHHLIPREMGSHRHVLKNAIILCASHHKYSFELSPHKAPVAFFRWLIEHDLERWKWLLSQEPSRKPNSTFKDIATQLEVEYNKFALLDIAKNKATKVPAMTPLTDPHDRGDL